MGFLGGALGMGGGLTGMALGSAVQDKAEGNSIWTPWSHPGGDWSPSGPGPDLPQYESPNIATGANATVNAPNIDQRGLNQYRDIALGDSSPWTKLQLQGEEANTLHAKDNANTQAASAGAQAFDQQAMNGGIRSGAAERTAQQAAIGGQLAQQKIGEGSEARKLGIQEAGQQQKLQALSQLPGMEVQAAQPGMQAQEFNVNAGLNRQQQENQARLQAAGNKNKYNADLFNTKSQLYGANQAANQAQYERNNQSLWDKIF